MSNLTEKVQNVGMCSKCNEVETRSIGYLEAQAAIEEVKSEIIEQLEVLFRENWEATAAEVFTVVRGVK